MAKIPPRGSPDRPENVAPVARADLRRVAKARRLLDEALDERDAAIRDAVASGETYRDVARMAGLSHQRVAQIVQGRA